MPIQYVGGVVGGRTGSTSTTTQSLSGTLTGGIDTSPKPHDLVIVTCVVGSQARNPAQAITGYTALTQLNPNTQTYDTSLCVSYKRMVNPADTSITIPASGNVADAQTWVVQVFRGVNYDTPLDVTPVSASGTGTTRANPAAITPVTAGAWVVACTGGAANTASALTFSGLTNVIGNNIAGTNDSVVACGYTTWTSGALDVAVSSTGDATATSSWAAYAIALRPNPDMSALTDDFDDGVLDTGKWATEIPAGSSVTESGGVINLEAADSSFVNLWGTVYRCLTGSAVAVRFVSPPQGISGAAAGYEAGLRLVDDVGNAFDFLWISDGTSTGALRTRYNGIQFGSTVAYSPSTHAWLRFRESAGTLYADVAPATASNPPVSGDWVNFASVTEATLGFPLSNIAVSLRVVRGASLPSPTGPAKFDGFNAAASVTATNTDSVANPATFGHTAAAATSLYSRVSQGLPATYSLAGAATLSARALLSAGLPAAFAYTGAAAASGRSTQSSADPATYSLAATAATAYRALLSQGTPAAYALTGAAGTDLRALLTSANPATYGHTGAAATSGRATLSTATPATYTFTGVAATDIKTQGGTANPATFGFTGAPATSFVTRISQAAPADFTLNPLPTGDSGTFSIPPVVSEPPYIPPVVTDAQFLAWLQDPTAIRVVLLETQYIDTLGNTTRVFLASRGYVSTLRDSVANQYYTPLIRGGLEFKQTLGLDLAGELSYGDIELDNSEGDLDSYFDMMWQYQPARAYVGDARWPRNDFRQIFDGSIEDIDSSARDTINLRLRDKMYRLQMPLHDQKIGGASAEADRLLPCVFGECHNVTPALKDASNLLYVFHAGDAEAAFEVRDNGVPIARVVNPGTPATFTLPKQPYGRVTVSVQGDKSGDGGYINDVGGLVQRIVKNWGTEADKRFTDQDIDVLNFAMFRANNPQAVGLCVSDRMTVLEACQVIAASIGARPTMTATGLLQLVKIEIPPIGTPIEVGTSDMVAGSLRIVKRLPLVSSVKLGYCKNWTIQEDTAAGLPEEHKALFSREWLPISMVDPGPRDKYDMWSEAPQENSLLLTQDDAGFEALRRLRLRSVQRHVYEFVGFADLIFTQVGAPMTIKHHRFGLRAGKTGQVTGVAVNWITAQVTIQVVI